MGVAVTERHITLCCQTCGTTWTIERRRGQYPRRCPQCIRRHASPQEALNAATRKGITAQLVQHPRLGLVCTTRTPWHEKPVYLRDREDVRFLHAELRAAA